MKDAINSASGQQWGRGPSWGPVGSSGLSSWAAGPRKHPRAHRESRNTSGHVGRAGTWFPQLREGAGPKAGGGRAAGRLPPRADPSLCSRGDASRGPGAAGAGAAGAGLCRRQRLPRGCCGAKAPTRPGPRLPPRLRLHPGGRRGLRWHRPEGVPAAAAGADQPPLTAGKRLHRPPWLYPASLVLCWKQWARCWCCTQFPSPTCGPPTISGSPFPHPAIPVPEQRGDFTLILSPHIKGGKKVGFFFLLILSPGPNEEFCPKYELLFMVKVFDFELSMKSMD